VLQSLVGYLDCWTGPYRNDVALKTAIMGFINAALKYGPGQVRNNLFILPADYAVCRSSFFRAVCNASAD